MDRAYAAQLGMQDDALTLLLDDHVGRAMGGRASVTLTDRHDGDDPDEVTGLVVRVSRARFGDLGLAVSPTLGKHPLPFRLRSSGLLTTHARHALGLSRTADIELFQSPGWPFSFVGTFELACHLRPWPKLRPCKAYDVTEVATELLERRLRSTAEAGDDWDPPPASFVRHCRTGVMALWAKMPEGSVLRLKDGRGEMRR